MPRQSTTATRHTNGSHGQNWGPNGLDMAMSMARVNSYTAQSVLRYNLELLDFYKHRLEQDLTTVNALIGCKDADEALDVGRKFMQNAVSEYTQKAGRLADISTKLATETAEHVQEETASIANTMSARNPD